MALNDRAAKVGPYLRQLLDDEDAQDAIRRAARASRDTYARARGKSAREAAKDEKLRRRLRQAVAAGWEAWSAVGKAPQRKSRWRLRLIALAGGCAAALMAVNPQARQKALSLFGNEDANTPDRSDSRRREADHG
jgi:hypothetical protein